ncbi:hypothetical protein I2W78_11005 [Streptomyces spinoverrucosus]|uniref:hypothetical protein n=1 Tax=Streptomyces spinoverrucosus TaxID=284043 RepID=UPI0018C4080B|nr:hypothetical protein [Streptomyces spinoverrucosus]MBG0852345.1 hypothetical protein [Streptomyces spinoverrucosus]
MYQYELQQMRSAELIRRAEHERLVSESVRRGRAARREAAERSKESEEHSHRPRRRRFPRPA